jgi:hypothetical protein
VCVFNCCLKSQFYDVSKADSIPELPKWLRIVDNILYICFQLAKKLVYRSTITKNLSTLLRGRSGERATVLEAVKGFWPWLCVFLTVKSQFYILYKNDYYIQLLLLVQ